MLRRHTRLNFAGSIHFITVVTRERGSWFTSDDICTAILESFEHHRRKCTALCYGYVLMPDHLHALIGQTEEGDVVPRLVREFKKWTSANHQPIGYPATTLWRDKYDDVPVPGSDAARTKVEYIHNNPVRRGLVESPEKYRWSSAVDYWGNGKSIIEVALV
ncbi:MAG: transposase [bacterium]|nr:transposase [bacterium]